MWHKNTHKQSLTGGPWIESPLGPWGPGGPEGPGGPISPTGPWGPCENNTIDFSVSRYTVSNMGKISNSIPTEQTPNEDHVLCSKPPKPLLSRWTKKKNENKKTPPSNFWQVFIWCSFYGSHGNMMPRLTWRLSGTLRALALE